MEGNQSTSTSSPVDPSDRIAAAASSSPAAAGDPTITKTTTTSAGDGVASPSTTSPHIATTPHRQRRRMEEAKPAASTASLSSSSVATSSKIATTTSTTNTTTTTSRQSSVPTSVSASAEAAAAAASAAAVNVPSTTLTAPTTALSSPSSAPGPAAAAATMASAARTQQQQQQQQQQNSQALVGGERRPRGAGSPAARVPVTSSGWEGEGGARTPASPRGPGTDQSDTTSGISPPGKPATLEEQKTPPAGHRIKEEKTSNLSTEEHHHPISPRHVASRATTGSSSSHSDRGREFARRGASKLLTVQFPEETSSSTCSPRPSPRDVGDVMQFFAEQEKSLQESFLSLPKKAVKKQRSPSPKVSAAAGLEHLDNLVRLMEQLGSLKDENSRLRQRCHYLESTKVLLQARKDLATFEAGETPARYKTMSSKQQLQQRLHHHHHHHHHYQKKGAAGGRAHSPRDATDGSDGGAEDGAAAGATSATSRLQHPSSRRSRISSAEDLDFWPIPDSSSDQRPKRSRSKSGLQKRSKSTGSLGVPSELLLDDVVASSGEPRKRFKSKTGRSIFSSKSGAKSKSGKSGSKWARVKKVLTGQKLYEDLGTTIRSIRDLGRSSTGHGRYSTSGVSVSPQEMSPPSSRVSSGEGRNQDSGLGLAAAASHDLPSGGHGGVARPPLVVVPFIPQADTDPASRSEQEGSDSELTCDIWMGPPDWWEEYEARTEGSGRRARSAEADAEARAEDGACGASVTNSDVSSVIEVTTVYLGTSKLDVPGASSSPTSSPSAATLSPLSASMTCSTISSSSTATPSSQASPLALAMVSPADQQFLTVDKSPLSRRQSSPSLNGKEASDEGGDFLDELATLSETPTRPLHKSSSCQSADLEFPRASDLSSGGEGRGASASQKSGKSQRTAWGRVKDIIHTRKDSVKRRPKKQRSEPKSGLESEETSEVDVEGLLMEDQFRSGSFGEGLLGRSTPKSSPLVIRQSSQQGAPLAVSAQQGAHSIPSRAVGADMAAILAGSMSDEFSKKMQEWEAKKSRKFSSVRVSGEDSDAGSLDVSGASQDIPVRTVDLRDLKGKVPDSSSDGTTPGESHTSLEVLGAPTAASAHLEEIQRRMTESFSRKMQEWEKLKYRTSVGGARDTSPDMERKGSKGRKDDRQKSKRSREDKEKEKLEKMREREMQKVEKEQAKLEKEKLRLEKERLQALEREAKLEKLKGRLSHTDTEPGFKNPVLGPLAEYKVTADFAHKLHQWELKKGLSHDVSNSIYLEAQKLNMQHLRQESARQHHPRFSLSTTEGGGGSEEAEGDKATSSQALALQQFWQSQDDGSTPVKYAEAGVAEGEEDVDADADADGDGDGEAEADDETTTSISEECLTKSNILTLERANRQLIENLQQKELEYASVQQQVLDVNQKLAKVKDEHAKEMARFHRELALGSIAEPVKLEVGELESTINTMEEKIKAMENLGERLALSMESAAVGKWQSIDGEETVHRQLVELVDQMRNMLVQASHSEEASKKSMALSNFEKLYSHAMKLQVQMNNLRLSHLERNREIMTVKRQLLLQEVNNLLLQADITRRETELYQYHAAKKFASLRRWNTFSGSDRTRPQAQVEIAAKPRIELQKDGRSKQIADVPHVNIPHIPEDVILASAASSSLSAPASPSAIEAAGGSPQGGSGGSPECHHQKDGTLTTSSAAGPHPYSRQQQQHHQHQQQQHPQQHQRAVGQLAGTGAALHTSDQSHAGTHLLTPPAPPAAAGRGSRVPPSLCSAPPASPSLVRAVSDPQQGKRKALLSGSAGAESGRDVSTSSSPHEHPPAPGTASRPVQLKKSASDGERVSPSPAVQSCQEGDVQLTVKGESTAGGRNQTVETQQQQQPSHLPSQPWMPSSSSSSPSFTPSSASAASVATTTKRTELITMSDSAPLYKEIRELRKAKSLVEKGSPTLILSKEGRGSSSAPSPGKSPSKDMNSSKQTGTPNQSIPQQPSAEASPPTTQLPRLTRAAASIDDDYSPASTVMESARASQPGTLSDHPRCASVTEPGAVGGASSGAVARLSPRSDSRRELPPTIDSGRAGSGKCPRSPVTKHNYLRRQKEERDANGGTTVKHLDYKAVSPKSSPVMTRGKPPLPRQNTPVRQSPQASPMAPDKGPRSKSVGEMSHSGGAASAVDAVVHKPLQDAINKFEKRQTMCETEERAVELRKTPSPTLHLPRVGLVSRVRRLKPAAELLEESQRYRSGHTIYATRIMQRYLPKEEAKPSSQADSSTGGASSGAAAATSGPAQNKENTFVHAMMRRLSRETSPVKSAGSSRTNSDLSLKRTDSPRSNSEFVTHIVRKLSSGSGSGSPKYRTSSASSPFKDRTNDGQVKKLALSFDDQHIGDSPERTLSDSNIGRQPQQSHPHRRLPSSSQSAVKSQHRKSCEVAMVLSSSSAEPTESDRLMSASLPCDSGQPESPNSSQPPQPPPNHQSLPALVPAQERAVSRGRAATYCSPHQEDRHKERHITPARPASTSAAISPHIKELSPGSGGARSKTSKAGRAPTSSLSPVRRSGAGRSKMDTVGVLCKQSISFDLGVSLYSQKTQAADEGSPRASRQVRSWDPSVRADAGAAAAHPDIVEAMTHFSEPGPSAATASSEGRPVSSGSECEMAPSSPQSEEKNKFRRFLDSSWLQKSKKFFKVSK